MRELKGLNLWESQVQLAEKKGRWINGTSSMRASQTYPPQFGKAIIMEMKYHLQIPRIVDSIRDEVTANLAEQRREEEWVRPVWWTYISEKQVLIEVKRYRQIVTINRLICGLSHRCSFYIGSSWNHLHAHSCQKTHFGSDAVFRGETFRV